MGPNPSHQYLVAGQFTARLLYTDDDGESDSDFVVITVAGAICGNGAVDPGEECDDGNMVNGDCCDSDCRYEPRETRRGPAPESGQCVAGLAAR